MNNRNLTGNDNSNHNGSEGRLVSSEMAKSDLEAIRAGIEDLEAGRFRPLTEVEAEIRKKYKILRQNSSS